MLAKSSGTIEMYNIDKFRHATSFIQILKIQKMLAKN